METFFITCAILGGVLFLVRLALQMLGGEHPDADLHHVGDSDASFKSLSLQGFMAFFTMFGLVGWALLRDEKVAVGWALVGGLAAGLAAIWAISKMFQGAHKLESSGNRDLSKAVGQTGTVYLTIPASGTGQVQVPVQGALQTVDARASKEELKTGTLVKVTGVVDGSILVVEKA